MKKKIHGAFVVLLIFAIAFQITLPNALAFNIYIDPSTEPLKVGDSFSWSGRYSYFGPTVNTRVTIKGLTTANWIVNLEPELEEIPMPLLVPTELFKTVPRNNTVDGFQVLSDGNCWGLWIDPNAITETDTFVLSNTLVGIPDLTDMASFMNGFWLNGPLTFEIEDGITKFGGKSYDIWLFSTETSVFKIYLFYEKSLGILLEARFIPKDNSLMGAPFSMGQVYTLVQTTREPPESNNFFNADLFGTIASWKVDLNYQENFLEVGSFELEITGESTNMIFASINPEYALYPMSILPLVMVIDKAPYGQHPFSLTHHGNVWGWWINTSVVKAMTYPGFNLNMSTFFYPLSGGLGLEIPEPFMIWSYISSLYSPITNEEEDVWCLQNGAWVGLDLYAYYDNKTGFLLKASYLCDTDEGPINLTQTLTHLTIPESEQIPGFNNLFSLLGVIGLMVVIYYNRRIINRKSKNIQKLNISA